MIRIFENSSISLSKGFHIYAKSWLGRYIPGKLAWVGGKILFSIQEGVSKKAATILSFLELTLQLQAGSLIALLFIFLVKNWSINMLGSHVLIIVIALLLFLLLPFTMNYFISFAYQILKRKKIKKRYLHLNKLLKTLLLVVSAKLSTGFFNSLLAWSIKPVMNFNEFIYVAGVSNLAGVLGMIAFFAPAGIGINEFTQISLLKEFFIEEKLLIYVALSRIISIIADVIFYGFTLILLKTRE